MITVNLKNNIAFNNFLISSGFLYVKSTKPTEIYYNKINWYIVTYSVGFLYKQLVLNITFLYSFSIFIYIILFLLIFLLQICFYNKAFLQTKFHQSNPSFSKCSLMRSSKLHLVLSNLQR